MDGKRYLGGLNVAAKHDRLWVILAAGAFLILAAVVWRWG